MKIKTPNCLPINKPIPNGTFSNKIKDNPSKETPAFAKANKGILQKHRG